MLIYSSGIFIVKFARMIKRLFIFFLNVGIISLHCAKICFSALLSTANVCCPRGGIHQLLFLLMEFSLLAIRRPGDICKIRFPSELSQRSRISCRSSTSFGLIRYGTAN